MEDELPPFQLPERCRPRRHGDVSISTKDKANTLSLVLAVPHGGADDFFAEVDHLRGPKTAYFRLRLVLVEHEKRATSVL